MAKIKKKKKIKKIVKKKTITSEDKNFKKISNKQFSEWIQRLIDDFDDQWLDSHVNHEVMLLPLGFQTFFADFLSDFGSHLRHHAKIDLTSIKCKAMYNEIVKFAESKWGNYLNSKNFDSVFFALSYSIAGICLKDRSARKMFGVSKGFFG